MMIIVMIITIIMSTVGTISIYSGLTMCQVPF